MKNHFKIVPVATLEKIARLDLSGGKLRVMIELLNEINWNEY